MKVVIGWGTCAALALTFACVACTSSSDDTDGSRPVAPAPDQPGPYAAGKTYIEAANPVYADDVTMEVDVYYPAISGGDDAEPDTSGGPYPLVLFSHGFFMYPETYSHLLEHLASHGFVVIGTKHRDSGKYITDAFSDLCYSIPVSDQMDELLNVITDIVPPDHPVRRPEEASYLLDFATELNASDPVLTGLMDLDNIGMVGHSFGGFTSIALGGGKIITADIAAACVDGPNLGDLISEPLKFLTCAMFETVDEQYMQGDLDFRDERVDAIVSLAGPLVLIWGNDYAGMEQVQTPMMMVYTDTDANVEIQTAVDTYALLQAPKYFLNMTGGNHGNYGTIDYDYFSSIRAELPESCDYETVVKALPGDPEDAPALPIEDQQRMVRYSVTAFLQQQVGGADASEYLTPEYYDEMAPSLQSYEYEE